MKTLVYHDPCKIDLSVDFGANTPAVHSTLKAGIQTLPTETKAPAASCHLDHPLLEAFGRAEYGELRLTLPHGQRLTFTASHEGPCADLRLRNWHALDRLLMRGQMGFAEAYVAGEWDSNDLPALFNYCLANTAMLERYFYGQAWYALWMRLKNAVAGNTVSRSRCNVLGSGPN